MLVMKVSLNGKPLSNAGSDDLVVLNATISAARVLSESSVGEGATKNGCDLTLNIEGLFGRLGSGDGQRKNWLTDQELSVGDEISVKIVDSDQAGIPEDVYDVHFSKDVSSSDVVCCDPLPVEITEELELPLSNGLYVLEMLNDDITPMEYVVQLLSKCLGKEQSHAIELMQKIHNVGSSQILAGNESTLIKVADYIQKDANARKYPVKFNIIKA
ncbi:MAG: ATP-dependent Clp protease adaptor ClpS [Arenicella sp.]